MKNKIYAFADRKIDKLDIILWAVGLAVLFISFCHPDIIITGNSGMFMQNHYLDFYDACKEWTGSASANYLPSTFFVFSIWTLPLRLFGFFPATVSDNILWNVAWYRLLPIGLFFLTGHYMKKIGLAMGMNEEKAKLTQILFLAFPTAIFSQFIFSQYDIFTVFPMVLGYWFYLKKKDLWFILCFGLAMTFKYQALIFFLVLLVLREKGIIRILLKTALCCVPAALEILLYWRSPGFQESVFGFSALSFVSNGFVYGGVYALNLFLIVVLAALIGAYITKNPDHKWDLFYLNMVVFAFFAVIVYNPQWILITVPFFVLTIMTNRHQKFMVILTEIFIVCDYFFVASLFIGNVDMVMFANSFLRSICPASWAITMRDVYPYTDWTNLWTVMFVIYSAFLVLSHPRFREKDINSIQQDTRINIRLGFLLSVFVWLIPAFYCLAVSNGWIAI